MKGGDLFTDSKIIANAIGLKHIEVLRRIEKLFIDFPDLRVVQNHPKNSKLKEVFIPEARVYRGNEYTAYLMNEQAFTLLLPRFETRRAKDAYRAFNNHFYELKATLLQAKTNSENLIWQELRIESKCIRHDLTDAIKAFSDYSKLQGSKGTSHLYGNITRAVYTHLGLMFNKAPRVRDSLSLMELEKLERLEAIISDLITHGMKSGLHYKKIKDSYKQRLTIIPDAIQNAA
jgi:phage regulator Rha-like protein